MSEYKQVILIRNDLKLPKGKIGAQCAHASVDAFIKADKKLANEWLISGMKKVVLKVDSEKELIKYFQMAKDSRLPASLITDAGRTVVEPGTRTAVGIGPALEEDVDELTGKLKML